MSVKRVLPAAQISAQIIQDRLEEVGLSTEIAHYVLTETEEGHAWVFTVFNLNRLSAVDTYLLNTVVVELARSLQGHRTVVCRRSGLRLAVRLL